nr:hypothetical protein GCM10020093_041740 [Planobispora longispora]
MRLDEHMGTYDALLVVSFGGPEKPDDVMPFLENVVRGRGFRGNACWRSRPTTSDSAESARSTGSAAT